MKIGVLGPGPGEQDGGVAALLAYGRERGHETARFALADLSYGAVATGGFTVLVNGQPAAGFDAVISRAKLHRDDWQDQVERLTAVSNVLGPGMFDPAENWVTACSTLLCTQRLAAGGISVLPTRSVTEPDHVAEALRTWGPLVLRPPIQSDDAEVVQVTDPAAGADLARHLLSLYTRLACRPYVPPEHDEYRLIVAGDTSCVIMLKRPLADPGPGPARAGTRFERVDGPPELVELAVRATRLMGLTLAGVDAVAAAGGYVILAVSPVPGIDGQGEAVKQQTMAGVYDWVEKQVAPG